MNERRILIIESDPLAQEALRDMLSGKHTVLQADTHEGALAQLSSSIPICAIILTINDRFSDNKFLRSLRDRAPNIPLVLHSGFPSVETNQTFPNYLQPYRLVRKSDPPEKLHEALTSMLNEHTN
jgi:DNA-binding NarL/FixJ family response regulator